MIHFSKYKIHLLFLSQMHKKQNRKIECYFLHLTKNGHKNERWFCISTVGENRRKDWKRRMDFLASKKLHIERCFRGYEHTQSLPLSLSLTHTHTHTHTQTWLHVRSINISRIFPSGWKTTPTFFFFIALYVWKFC